MTALRYYFITAGLVLFRVIEFEYVGAVDSLFDENYTGCPKNQRTAGTESGV